MPSLELALHCALSPGFGPDGVHNAPVFGWWWGNRLGTAATMSQDRERGCLASWARPHVAHGLNVPALDSTYQPCQGHSCCGWQRHLMCLWNFSFERLRCWFMMGDGKFLFAPFSRWRSDSKKSPTHQITMQPLQQRCLTTTSFGLCLTSVLWR